MKLLRNGKVKDIYQLENGNILFHFSDRVSAYDVKMITPIPRKGEVLCKFAEFWFKSIDTKHHMIKRQDSDKMVVRPLHMIPVECIVRGYFYGSLVERYLKKDSNLLLPIDFQPLLAAKLPQPVFDPTTKSELHDIPIGIEQILSSHLLSIKEFDYLKKTSISLYEKMSEIADRAGFIMADVKFEFGRDPSSGEILLGDSLGPDEFRLWLKSDYIPGKAQDSYDKQLLRDWLIKIGFRDLLDEYSKEGRKPDPPIISEQIVKELSNRYIHAYEKITGEKL
ncbi:MAG TPA: phosphoribosylaminoimidazolesuccinocarboxamide synthase [Nitrososphaeraceae archaeon]|jgi:phosphoribosylaminoimidazole-succinocarboxamide synthase|nr:phosphoribosylaminoimidazolesuccinocarboxamide synthase [Nitrososphaeraceae archaeon]